MVLKLKNLEKRYHVKNFIFVLFLSFCFISCGEIYKIADSADAIKDAATDIACEYLDKAGCYSDATFIAAFPDFTVDTCTTQIQHFTSIVVRPNKLKDVYKAGCLQTLKNLRLKIPKI